MELHRPKHIISWHSAVLKLVLKVKSCESAGTQKVSKDENTLAVNLTGPPLSAISQTRPNILFSLSPLPDRISPVKTESYFSFSYESSLQICVTISNNKLKSRTENVPVQPCTIITSTWRRPASALSTVKFPSGAHALDKPITAPTWTSTVCSALK